MQWLDVAGPPGVGKSTICDPLWHSQFRFDDGKLPPADWQPFLDEITRLFGLIREHWSFTAAVRMNRRSVRKMATVARMPSYEINSWQDGAGGGVSGGPAKPYIQTGLIQRGLGFGWRLNDMGGDLNEIRPYFRLMPVSLGAAFLTAPVEAIEARNKARLEKPETAHENRAFMVPLMQKPIEIAQEVLRERGVRILDVDTTGSPEAARAALVDFATARAAQSEPVGHSSQETVLRPPPWWG